MEYYSGCTSSPSCLQCCRFCFTISKCCWDFAPSAGQSPCGATRVARHWAEVRPSLENKTKCSLSSKKKKNLIWNTKKQRMDFIKMQIQCKLHEFNSTQTLRWRWKKKKNCIETSPSAERPAAARRSENYLLTLEPRSMVSN